MASPDALEQTDVRLGLLRDIADGRVVDDADFQPTMTVDGEPVPVGPGVWELERHGWARQPCTSRLWEPTPFGRALLEEVAADALLDSVIAEAKAAGEVTGA